MVAEYESNSIADDSEDEKKILKAQSRAEKKVKDSVKPRGRGRPHPYGRGDSRSYGRSDPSLRTEEGGHNLRRPRKCFECVVQGHCARECRRKVTEDKIRSHYIIRVQNTFQNYARGRFP